MPTGKKVKPAAPAAKAASGKTATKAKATPAAKSKPAAKLAPESKTKPVKKTVAKVSKSAPVKAAVPAKPVAPVKPEKAIKLKTPAVKIAPVVKEVDEVPPLIRAREKKYTELFGASQPKGKGVDIQGETMSAAQVEAQGWSLMQFPPPAGRMSWIYATHGLSTMRATGADKPTRIELVMHWREKHTQPLELLASLVKYILESGNIPVPGHIITAQDGLVSNIDMARHCVALDGAPSIPAKIEIAGGSFTPLVMLGISDAELEYALKVPPQLADGKQVLMEAVRVGGVFPVTDPKRLCLTRRRDFNKVWESAFRTIRERKPR